MLEARNLWELVERRAEATPDARSRPSTRTAARSPWPELKARRERAAAGLARLGIGEGDVVSWQLPDLARVDGARARAGPPRRDPEPDAADLPPARGRLHHPPGRRPSCSSCPATWRGLRLRGDGRAAIASASRARPRGAGGRPGAAAGRPVDAAAAAGATRTADDAASAGTSTRRARRPTRRAPSTPTRTIMAGAVGHVRAARGHRRRTARRCVFPFTHIGGIGWLFSALAYGLPDCRTSRRSTRQGHVAMLQQHERHHRRGGHAVPHGLPRRTSASTPGDAPLFPNVRVLHGGGAPKPPQLHYDIKAEIGGVGIVSGYGLTEAPIVAMASVRRHRRGARQHRGPGAGAASSCGPSRSTARSAGIGEEGEIRVKAPQLMKGYLDASLDAEAFDEDG